MRLDGHVSRRRCGTKILGIWIFTFLFGVIAVGCAAGPTLTPVTDPTQRLQFQGFFILPPRGEGWFIGQQGANQIAFAKGPASNSVIASVRTMSLGGVKFESRTELLQSLARTWGKGKIDPRHRLLDLKVSLDKCLGWDCMRYEITAEDRAVPQFPGSVFVMPLRGFLFLHPDSPTYVIILEYSQRYLQGQEPLSIKAEVEPFLKSLIFTPYVTTQSPLEDAIGYLFRGNIFAEKGQYDQAVSDFTKALEINPRFAEAYLQRGFARDRLRDFVGALQDFEKALEYEPDPSKRNYIAWVIQNTKFVMGK